MWQRIIEARLTRNPFLFIIWLLLIPFSFVYGACMALRNLFYDIGIFHMHRSKALVVSIGNIAVGGTGKTPLTLKLCQEFSIDVKVAVLSRGYKALAERLPKPILVHAKTLPATCGDEPYLVAKNARDADVIVGKSRVDGAKFAESLGADLIFLDDGMQHRKLARDFNVVLLDPKNFLDSLFPAGRLRERKNALKRADLIVLNPVFDEKEFFRAKHCVQAPLVGVQPKAEAFLGDKSISLQGKSAYLFCGIANPKRFFKSVANLGAQVCGSHFIEDHGKFSLKALQNIAEKAKALGAEMLVCTEKDFVKYPKDISLSLPIVWLSLDLDVAFGVEEWKLFLGRVREKLRSRVY